MDSPQHPDLAASAGLEEALAEAQRHREALQRHLEIEAALERIRARSMAMHTSVELIDVIQVIQDQLITLGLAVKTSAFDLIDQETGTVTHWTTDWTWKGVPGRLDGVSVPLDKEGLVWQSRQAALGQGMAYSVTEISAASLKAFITFAVDAFGAPPVWKDLALDDLPERYFFNTAIISQGLLVTHSSVPYSDEHLQILVRFSRVFEQAYIRFLDLKKAEAQAREAQIEAALEHVRARSMAMHKSEELREVVSVLHEQLDALGLADWGCSIMIFDKASNRIEYWVAESTGSDLNSYYVEGQRHPVYKKLWKLWEQQGPPLTLHHTDEVKREFDEFWLNETDFKALPEEVRSSVLNEREIFLSYISMRHGLLSAYGYQHLPDEKIAILQRFTRVFEQTYTRFLDLKQAEKQAREAQIEAALERVRSRAMAMQRSDELREVVSKVFEELRRLDFDAPACSIGIFDEATRASEWWTASTSNIILPRSYSIPYLEDWPHDWYQTVYNNWQQGVPFFTCSFEGEAKRAFDHKLVSETEFGLIGDSSVDDIVPLESLILSYATLTHGVLEVGTTEPISEDLIHILQRFARVIDLTYTRFDDLQQAEARTRDAVRQASLDRVRAEIASMRTADDLQRITPLVWRELTALGVPFFRCGVFIIEEAHETTHTYLSTPDGTALAALHLPFDSIPLVAQVVAHWHRRQVYTEEWDQDQFAAWVAAMVKQGHLDAAEAYQGGEAPPEALALHFLPFTQGMLYIGSSAPLSEEEVDLGQALANAFSVAYARYEDFRALETKNEEVERAMRELKATQNQLIQSEKMASLGALTAGIAHEIKNPLNFITNFAEVNIEIADELREDLAHHPDALATVEDLLADLKQNARVINQHGHRADGIVRSMMQHASGGTGEHAPTAVNTLVEEYIGLAYHGKRAQVPGFNVDLIQNLDPETGAVSMIPQEIGRVLLNLLGNAFDAVHEKADAEPGYEPTVTVSTVRHKDGVKIRISDNGPGIPPAVQKKIFEPFYTTKPTGSGTGLGLSLSYDIVTQGHGGTLTVEGVEGNGATFIVTLPVGNGSVDLP